MLEFYGGRDSSSQLPLPCQGAHVLLPHESQLSESLVTVGGVCSLSAAQEVQLHIKGVQNPPPASLLSGPTLTQTKVRVPKA